MWKLRSKLDAESNRRNGHGVQLVTRDERGIQDAIQVDRIGSPLGFGAAIPMNQARILTVSATLRLRKARVGELSRAVPVMLSTSRGAGKVVIFQWSRYGRLYASTCTRSQTHVGRLATGTNSRSTGEEREKALTWLSSCAPGPG